MVRQCDSSSGVADGLLNVMTYASARKTELWKRYRGVGLYQIMACSCLLGGRPTSKGCHGGRQLGLPLAAKLIGQRHRHHRVVQGPELLQRPLWRNRGARNSML